MVFTVAVRDGDRDRRWHRAATRRQVIGVAGTVGATLTLAGCTWTGTTTSVPPPPPDPLEPLLRSTRTLISHYQRLLDAHPQMADTLTPLHGSHTAHLAALQELIDGRSPGPALPDGTPVPPASPPAGIGAPPGAAWAPGTASPPGEVEIATEPEEAVGDLHVAEQHAFEEAVRACLAATPQRTAILGSICAARATHLEVLA
jgi:hypothetical protein